MRHIVETCPDDLGQLQERLDTLASGGARIISVIWQQRRLAEEEQAAALEGRGSYVIIADSGATDGPLRPGRETAASGVITS
jgi:hypothetical protein